MTKMRNKGVLYKFVDDKTWTVDDGKVIDSLVDEALRLPPGFEAEVYFDKRTGKLSVSSPMTSNNWTRDPEVVGRIEALSISDVDGFKQIDDDFVEIDDESGETDPDFKDEEYERYYGDTSSIVKYDEAIDRIKEISNGEEKASWYDDIIEEITDIVEGKKKEVVA